MTLRYSLEYVQNNQTTTLNDLKEKGTYRRDTSNPFFIPDTSTKDLYWPVFKLPNDKYDALLQL